MKSDGFKIPRSVEILHSIIFTYDKRHQTPHNRHENINMGLMFAPDPSPPSPPSRE